MEAVKKIIIWSMLLCLMAASAAAELSVSGSTEVDINNNSGNATSQTICYNSTGGGNITISLMGNLSGACNYGRFNASGYTDTVESLEFMRNDTFSECNLTVYLSDEAITDGCFMVYENEAAGDTNLTAIIAASAVAVTVIFAIYKWTSSG